MNLATQTGGGGAGPGENQTLAAAPPEAQQQQQQSQSQASSPSAQTSHHPAHPNPPHQQHQHQHQHPTGPPQRQSSIPVPNALLNTVNANKQRQPMCPECEKSLPNQIVFDKIESIIRKMQDEQNGLPVKTAKSFMTKIPSVFTGTDLIAWMMRNLRLEDQQEAIHLANLIASHGYIFPIEDHTLSIKNDATFYRFQTPYLWPSNNMDPENTDYAVYLCKRTMQGKTRLELADYEAENLARLQKMFSRKWDFIFMQAESQAKVDKKRDKLERKVLDSQERAFWDVYRPVPGCVNTTELDIKKACRLSKSAKRCGECQKVAPVVTAVVAAVAATAATSSLLSSGSSLHASQHQPPAPSPSPEVAQMKGDQQVHRLSFRQTTPTKQQRSPLEPRENHKPAVQQQQPADSQQVAGETSKQIEEEKSNAESRAGEAHEGENEARPKEGKAKDNDDQNQKLEPSNGEMETSELVKSEQLSVSNNSSNSQAGSSSDQKQQVQSKQASSNSSHHHHSHPHHHHHHHQHHHHHHHPHSHAHHAHHHHHHHHHRSCPHHHAKQQQQQQQLAQAQAQARTSGDGQPAQESSGTSSTGSSGPNRCQGRCSMRSKQRSSGSVDQLMGPPVPGTSRRKSECNRMLSMAEKPGSDVAAAAAASAQKSTKESESSASQTKQQQQQQRSILKPKSAEMTDRPASACALSSSAGSRGDSATTATELPETTTTSGDLARTPAQAVASGVHTKSTVPTMYLQRKSSLNIVRPPSVDQVTALLATQQSGRGAAAAAAATAADPTLVPAVANVRKGSVTSAAQQRAQLKGAASICTPPTALLQACGSSQDLHPIGLGGGGGGGLVRAGSATGRRELGAVTGAAGSNMNDLERELESLRIRLDRGGVKMSKVTQSYLSYFNQWAEYDPFIAQPLPSNPWQSDSTELWDSERQTKDVHCRRVRRWAFSLKELLNDPAGREQFHRFLEKEFSAENLKFWDAVQELKRVHARDVSRRVEAIWTEYLAQDANCPINIDSKSYETSKKNMAKNKNNRYIFDEAAGHVYQLMKNDSYPRYLRSDMYKDYKEASERRRPNQVAFDVFKPQITTLKHKFNF